MVNSKLTILIFSFVLILNMSATLARADSIRDHCKGIAGESYSLMETCMRGEEEARGRLQSHSIDPRIASYCKRIVGGSYTLMETCIRSEMEAKANIQSRPTDSQENATSSKGGEKRQLASLLTDYADLRGRVQEVRETRKSGYASDSNDMAALTKEISEAKVATYKFRSANRKAGEAANKTIFTTSFMIYAYEAMSEIINAEIERNLYFPNSDVPLRLAEKYEEIWKIIDPSIPEVSVQ